MVFALYDLPRTSGGGEVVLRNLRLLRRSHAELFAGEERSKSQWLIPRNWVDSAVLLRGNYVLMPQNAWPWTGQSRGLRSGFSRGLLRIASECSIGRAEGLVRIGTAIPDRGRVLGPVIPNVLDEEFEDILDSFDPQLLPENVSNTFLAVGSWTPYRNYETLLDGYALYRAAGGAWDLLIGIPGTTGFDTSRLPGVKILNKVSRVDVIEAYLRSGAAIFPSSVEASPVSVLEASEVGIPMIVSDISGHRDLPIRALKFPATNSKFLSELMLRKEFESQKPVQRFEYCKLRACDRRKAREAWISGLAEQLQNVCR